MGTKVGESWFAAELWEVLGGLAWPQVRVATSWRRKRWGWREVPGCSFQTLCSLNAEIQPRSVNPKALNSESGLRFFALLLDLPKKQSLSQSGTCAPGPRGWGTRITALLPQPPGDSHSSLSHACSCRPVLPDWRCWLWSRKDGRVGTGK